MIRRVVFRPAALRDFARLDRIVQARIDAALLRYANTGFGDIKALTGRPGESRLRVGEWRLFFLLQPPEVVRVVAIGWTGFRLRWRYRGASLNAADPTLDQRLPGRPVISTPSVPGRHD